MVNIRLVAFVSFVSLGSAIVSGCEFKNADGGVVELKTEKFLKPITPGNDDDDIIIIIEPPAGGKATSLEEFSAGELSRENGISRTQLGNLRVDTGFDPAKKKCWARAVAETSEKYYNANKNIGVVNAQTGERFAAFNNLWNGSVYRLYIPSIDKFYGYITPMSTFGPATNHMVGDVHVLEWDHQELNENPALHFHPTPIGLPPLTDFDKKDAIAGKRVDVGRATYFIDVTSTWFATDAPPYWSERKGRGEYFPCVATI